LQIRSAVGVRARMAAVEGGKANSSSAGRVRGPQPNTSTSASNTAGGPAARRFP
jgi:hypothetical protein